MASPVVLPISVSIASAKSQVEITEILKSATMSEVMDIAGVERERLATLQKEEKKAMRDADKEAKKAMLEIRKEAAKEAAIAQRAVVAEAKLADKNAQKEKKIAERAAAKVKNEAEKLERQMKKKEEKLDNGATKKAEKLAKVAAKESAKETAKAERVAKKLAKAKVSDSEGEGEGESDGTSESKKGKVGRPRKERVHKNRKPREPTLYNLFIKDALNAIKVENPSLDTKERMKLAVEKWRAQGDCDGGDSSLNKTCEGKKNKKGNKTFILF